jgi:hypothetical protein
MTFTISAILIVCIWVGKDMCFTAIDNSTIIKYKFLHKLLMASVAFIGIMSAVSINASVIDLLPTAGFSKSLLMTCVLIFGFMTIKDLCLERIERISDTGKYLFYISVLRIIVWFILVIGVIEILEVYKHTSGL